MDNNIHPLLRPHRPIITTPPILALANAMRAALEDGHQGMNARGGARAGKSFAQRWLMTRSGWHTQALASLSVRVPRHTKIRDGYIYQLILMASKQKLSSRLSDLETLGRVRDLFEGMCYATEADTLLLLVDEAQRLSQEEIADFLTIVNESESWAIHVFIVFFHQTDVTGVDAERARAQLPPHIKGRFGLADHHFHGLRGEEEIAAVLKRYDENAKWPVGSDITYTAHFAPAAYADGWRLAQHTKEIIEVVEALRAAYGLGPLGEWPMKSFELFVQRALTRVAVRPQFHGLAREDVSECLHTCGYIALEFARAHMADDDAE